MIYGLHKKKHFCKCNIQICFKLPAATLGPVPNWMQMNLRWLKPEIQSEFLHVGECAVPSAMLS